MEQDEAQKIVEAILFVSDSPVTLEDLGNVLNGIDGENIRSLIDDLNGKYEGHGIFIMEVAEGYQLRTRPEIIKWIKKFHKINRSTRLSQAALETLSIIAYRQPITRQEIEDIRGVDCTGVVKTLLDKNLIKSIGRKKVAGRPMTLGTTRKFLEYFGLTKLTDMPTLKDFQDVSEDGSIQEALEFNEDDENQEDEEFNGEKAGSEELSGANEEDQGDSA